MGHFLNFGAGPNQLPEPWQNLNAEHDLRKRLRFEDGSASRILAEHVIEHVPFLQGYGFLQECFRVLELDGILRLAFPDPVGLLAIGVGGYELGPRAEEYAAELAKRPDGEIVRNARDKRRAASMMMMIGWNHQSIWTLYSAAAVLCTVGFRKVQTRRYGEGMLHGVDGHHLDVGHKLAEIETTIVEALK